MTTLSIPSRFEIAWKPQEKQLKVLRCPFDEILYGGTAGCGKSDCLLGDFYAHSQRFEKASGFSKGAFFRKTYKALEDIVQRSHFIFGAMGWKFEKDTLTWRSPKGSQLQFLYLDTYEDAQDKRGFEWDWLGFDELTLWRTDAEYEYVKTRLRVPSNRCKNEELGKKLKPRIVASTNPGGPGHSWVKKRWAIDLYPNGDHPITEDVYLEDGRKVSSTRVFIRGWLKDNRFYYEDGNYEANLRLKTANTQKMLLDGRWDIMEGAFFSEWDPTFHTCKAFTVPKDAVVWMGGDWGTAKPYSFGWYHRTPDGVIYRIAELYGWSGKENIGTYESVLDVGQKIREVENRHGWTVRERYLDASCFDDSKGLGICEADQFASRAGGNIVFQKAQKKNKTGAINLLRTYLRVINGQTAFRIFDTCTHAIRTIPAIGTSKDNPEQYDTDGEDHALDEILYALRKNMVNFDNQDHNQKLIRANKRAIDYYGSGGAR